MKTCSKCNQELSLTEFYKRDQTRYRSACKKCEVAANLERYRKTGGKAAQAVRSRKHNLKKYGLTAEQYDLMLESQGGVCAICSTEGAFESRQGYRLFVDHCHITGNVRGLLCHSCNAGLGHFRDSTQLLETASRYLNENRSRHRNKLET